MVELDLTVARSEMILGGQKSGKSRRAESLARGWLAQSDLHKAVLVATAQPWDDEMRERIVRHQRDRSERVPGMTTVEEPLALAETVLQHSRPDTLLVVDCLTLWLTNWLMPMNPAPEQDELRLNSIGEPVERLIEAIARAAGPLVLVSNEIGLGVIPLGSDVRSFVDTLGQLNQRVAAQCQRVTLMAAGLPLTLKETT